MPVLYCSALYLAVRIALLVPPVSPPRCKIRTPRVEYISVALGAPLKALRSLVFRTLDLLHNRRTATRKELGGLLPMARDLFGSFQLGETYLKWGIAFITPVMM